MKRSRLSRLLEGHQEALLLDKVWASLLVHARHSEDLSAEKILKFLANEAAGMLPGWKVVTEVAKRMARGALEYSDGVMTGPQWEEEWFPLLDGRRCFMSRSLEKFSRNAPEGTAMCVEVVLSFREDDDETERFNGSEGGGRIFLVMQVPENRIRVVR